MAASPWNVDEDHKGTGTGSEPPSRDPFANPSFRPSARRAKIIKSHILLHSFNKIKDKIKKDTESPEKEESMANWAPTLASIIATVGTGLTVIAVVISYVDSINIANQKAADAGIHAIQAIQASTLAQNKEALAEIRGMKQEIIQSTELMRKDIQQSNALLRKDIDIKLLSHQVENHKKR